MYQYVFQENQIYSARHYQFSKSQKSQINTEAKRLKAGWPTYSSLLFRIKTHKHNSAQIKAPRFILLKNVITSYPL